MAIRCMQLVSGACVLAHSLAPQIQASPPAAVPHLSLSLIPCLDAGLVTAALGLASFSLAGLYCNHAISLFVIGSTVFSKFGSADKQDFSNNTPFW